MSHSGLEPRAVKTETPRLLREGRAQRHLDRLWERSAVALQSPQHRQPKQTESELRRYGIARQAEHERAPPPSKREWLTGFNLYLPEVDAHALGFERRLH